METILINSLVVLISVYFGFYLSERARTKKDKEETEQIFNILQDEIKSNLDNNLDKDFSSEYLSILGEEVLKAKMGMLAAYYKDPLGNFVKIYRQFVNINKALSDYNNLDKPSLTTNINEMIPQMIAKKDIIQLRKSCKKDIEIYLGKYFK
jgi:hypothetical protein